MNKKQAKRLAKLYRKGNLFLGYDPEGEKLAITDGYTLIVDIYTSAHGGSYDYFKEKWNSYKSVEDIPNIGKWATKDDIKIWSSDGREVNPFNSKLFNQLGEHKVEFTKFYFKYKESVGKEETMLHIFYNEGRYGAINAKYDLIKEIAMDTADVVYQDTEDAPLTFYNKALDTVKALIMPYIPDTTHIETEIKELKEV